MLDLEGQPTDHYITGFRDLQVKGTRGLEVVEKVETNLLLFGGPVMLFLGQAMPIKNSGFIAFLGISENNKNCTEHAFLLHRH
jgi:hypothetical protein